MNEPVKKKSKALWISFGIGCLGFLCIATVIGVAIIYFVLGGPAKEASSLLSDGNSKYNSATQSLKKINPLIDEFSKGKSDNKTTKLAVEAKQIILQADSDFKEAKNSFDGIADLNVSDELKRKGSLNAEATKQMQSAVKKYGEWIEDSAAKIEFLDKFIKAYNKSHLARKELYTAVNANNNNNRERTLLYAQRAQLHYKEAKVLSSEANEIMKEPSNETLIKSDGFMIKCADYAIELGKIGRTGNITKYNAARDKYEVNRKAGQALFPQITLIDKKNEWVQENVSAGGNETLDLIKAADKKKQEADAISTNEE